RRTGVLFRRTGVRKERRFGRGELGGRGRRHVRRALAGVGVGQVGDAGRLRNVGGALGQEGDGDSPLVGDLHLRRVGVVGVGVGVGVGPLADRQLAGL